MKQPAKKITLAILVVAFIVGLVGCFIKAFDMGKFKLFLESYAPFWKIMVFSIGAGTIADKLKDWKNHDDKTSN